MGMVHAHGHALDVASPFPGTETEKVGAHIAKTMMSFLFLFGEVDTGNSKTRILGAWPMDMQNPQQYTICPGAPSRFILSLNIKTSDSWHPCIDASLPMKYLNTL